MTASYDYYELRYPHEGLRGGFIWKTVPHVTLESIANNPDIDEIYRRLHPAIEAALGALNRALLSSPSPSRGGAGRGWGNAGGRDEKTHPHPSPPLEGEGTGLQEWEVPFDFPADADEKARAPFEAFHAARQSMQKAMDRSIADHADQETLYDQSAKSKNRLRITGPFSVEAVPFPTVQALDDESRRWQDGTADASIARSGELFPLPKMIVFGAFAFDPEAAKDIDHLKGIVALKAQMNTDLLTDDLKWTSAPNSTRTRWKPSTARCRCPLRQG